MGLFDDLTSDLAPPAAGGAMPGRAAPAAVPPPVAMSGSSMFDDLVADIAPPAPVVPKAAGPGAIKRGIVSGLAEGIPQSLAGAAEMAGLDGIATSLRESGRAPEEYRPQIPRLSNIPGDGIGDTASRALTFAGETFGQGIASTLPSVASGLLGAAGGAAVGGPVGATVGGLAGAAVPSFALNTGDLFNALREEGLDVETSRRVALAGGIPITGLDVASLGSLGKALLGPAKKEATRGIAKRLAAEFGKGATIEAGTEGLQQSIQSAIVAEAADKPFFTAETGEDIAQAMVGGALVGGPMRAPAGIRSGKPPATTEAVPPQVEPETRPPIAGLLPPPDTTYGKGFSARPPRPGEGETIDPAAALRAQAEARRADGPPSDPPPAPGAPLALPLPAQTDDAGRVRGETFTMAPPDSATIDDYRDPEAPRLPAPPDQSAIEAPPARLQIGSRSDTLPQGEGFTLGAPQADPVDRAEYAVRGLPPGQPVPSAFLAKVTGYRGRVVEDVRSILVERGVIVQDGNKWLRAPEPPVAGPQLPTTTQPAGFRPDIAPEPPSSPAPVAAPVVPPPAVEPAIQQERAAATAPSVAPAAPVVTSEPPRPAPEPRPTASWVIRNKATGEVVMETFDRKKVDALNTEKYEAVPIGKYLAGLNGKQASVDGERLTTFVIVDPMGKTQRMPVADDVAAWQQGQPLPETTKQAWAVYRAELPAGYKLQAVEVGIKPKRATSALAPAEPAPQAALRVRMRQAEPVGRDAENKARLRAEVEARHGDSIAYDEQRGFWRLGKIGGYRSRDEALSAATQKHGPGIAKELGLDIRTAKQRATDEANRKSRDDARAQRMAPFLSQARAELEEMGEAATPEEIESLALNLADDADKAEREATDDAVRERRVRTIDDIAAQLESALGGVGEGSNLSGSRYVKVGDVKIRVSDHELPPSYARARGVPDIDISVGDQTWGDATDAIGGEASAAEIKELLSAVVTRAKRLAAERADPAEPAPQAALRARMRQAGPAAPPTVDVRERAPRATGPRNLLQFIADRGGIWDEGGELKAMDLHLYRRPGMKKLVVGSGRDRQEAFDNSVRRSPVQPDMVLAAAIEAGYLPEDATVNDLYEAMSATMRGSPVYAVDDIPTIQARDEAKVVREERREERRSLEQAADDYGIDPRRLSDKTLLARIAAAEAKVERAERLALKAQGRKGKTDERSAEDDIPWDDAPPARSAERGDAVSPFDEPEQGAGRGSPDGEPRSDGSDRRVGPAEVGAAPDAERASPSAEKVSGVDGSDEQLVVPGAEKLTGAEVRQAKAEERETRTAAEERIARQQSMLRRGNQKSVNDQGGGLFEDAAKKDQGALFSRPNEIVPVPESTARWMGVDSGDLKADFAALQRRHPEAFKTPDDARDAVAYILRRPDDWFPHAEGRVMIFRQADTKANIPAFRIEAERSGDGWRVSSVYRMNARQIAVKMAEKRKWVEAWRRAGSSLASPTVSDYLRGGGLPGDPSGSLRQAPQNVGSAPSADKAISALRADLAKRLSELGIAEKAKVRLVDAVDDKGSDGRYFRRLIEVSLTAKDKGFTLDHEAVHALRDMGLITKTEWNLLANAARADKDLMRSARKRYPELIDDMDALTEEAVADMFAGWSADRRGVNGIVARIFAGLRDFFAGLRDAVMGAGIRSEADLFRMIDRGEIGAREGGSISPESFRAEAAKFARSLDADVSAADILSAGGAMFQRQQAKGSAPQEAIMSRILGPEKKPLGERIKDYFASWKGNVAREMRQSMADQYDAIAVAEKKVYGALQDASTSAYKRARMLNTGSVSHHLLNTGMVEFQNGAWQPRAGFEGGFNGIFRGIAEKGQLRLWQAWAIANRSQRLIKEGRESLLSQADIDELLKLGQQHPEFVAAQRKWAAFNRAVLDMAEQGGVVSAEARKVWENDDYVPFYRILEDDKPKGPGSKAGLSGQKSGIRALKGGEAQINDLFENMVKNMTHLVDASMKNKAAQEAIDVGLKAGMAERTALAWEKRKLSPEQLAEALEDLGVQVQGMTQAQKNAYAEVWMMKQPTDRDTFSILFDGKPQYFKGTDPYFLRAMTSINWPGFQSMAVRLMGGAKTLLTRGVTSFPDFMLANAMRDSLASWVVTSGKTNPWTAAKGFADSLKGGASLDALRAAGADTAGFYAVDPEAASKELRELSEGRTVKRGARKLWETWEKIGRASDNANRLALYDRLRKDGVSPAEAAYQAMDLMDFSMRGDAAAMRFLTTVVPFLNARVQGLYKLGRAAAASPGAFMLRGSMITAASLALLAANTGNPDYEELPDEDKDGNYHLFIGDTHIRLPKPFEVGAIYSTIPERLARTAMGTDDPEKFAKRLGRMVMDTFAMDPTPQLAKPLIEQYANKTAFTGTPIVSRDLERLRPGEQRNDRTSGFSELLGRMFPETVSPVRLDAAMRGYLGTLGTYLMGASTAVSDAVTDGERPAMRLADYPVVGRFLRDKPAATTQYLRDFYDIQKDVSAVAASIRRLAQEGKVEESAKLRAENPKALGATAAADRIGDRLSQINKQIRMVRVDQTMGADKKRAELDRLFLMRNQTAKSGAEALKTARE